MEKCSACGKKPAAFECGCGCGRTYCSEECAAADWTADHRDYSTWSDEEVLRLLEKTLGGARSVDANGDKRKREEEPDPRRRTSGGLLDLPPHLLREILRNRLGFRERAILSHSCRRIRELVLTDPSAGDADNLLLEAACRTGDEEAVRTLLKNPWVDPTDHNSDCLYRAVKARNHGIVETLLKDGRANPSAGAVGKEYAQSCLSMALRNHDDRMVRLLLSDPRTKVPTRAFAEGYFKSYLLDDWLPQTFSEDSLAALLDHRSMHPNLARDYTFYNRVFASGEDAILTWLRHPKLARDLDAPEDEKGLKTSHAEYLLLDHIFFGSSFQSLQNRDLDKLNFYECIAEDGWVLRPERTRYALHFVPEGRAPEVAGSIMLRWSEWELAGRHEHDEENMDETLEEYLALNPDAKSCAIAFLRFAVEPYPGALRILINHLLDGGAGGEAVEVGPGEPPHPLYRVVLLGLLEAPWKRDERLALFREALGLIPLRPDDEELAAFAHALLEALARVGREDAEARRYAERVALAALERGAFRNVWPRTVLLAAETAGVAFLGPFLRKTPRERAHADVLAGAARNPDGAAAVALVREWLDAGVRRKNPEETK